MLNKVIFGNLKSNYIKVWTDLSFKEHLILFPLAFLTLLFGFLPNMVLYTSFAEISNISYLIFF
jgi:NADH:ubiquinone oxidoreductase subunit 4 (subunit M)